MCIVREKHLPKLFRETSLTDYQLDTDQVLNTWSVSILNYRFI